MSHLLLTLALFAFPMCCDLTYCWDDDSGLQRLVGFENGSLVLMWSVAPLQEGWSLLPHGPRLGVVGAGIGPERSGWLVCSWLVMTFVWFAFQYLKVGLWKGLKMLHESGPKIAKTAKF
ncbi:MAG: hypothetical protein H6718_24155 [Polyangiaceae bacterium]|nr:hypothetical protein [Myxococcales bacterium]MCB9588524.1 hypothetical protein [Polyangiaceae bacterium]